MHFSENQQKYLYHNGNNRYIAKFTSFNKPFERLLTEGNYTTKDFKFIVQLRSVYVYLRKEGNDYRMTGWDFTPSLAPSELHLVPVFQEAPKLELE